ncbi:peptidylprolyl isomerase/FKBP-type peptidyl-prolyl cis-trans isomerase SlyD [Erythrobacter litoralis]|jgi:FKBP-type peptidyl-prolyl cis-trans isomerase SlyD|uniref:Peptidyl-prolyl cis-trans isomerase n=1 Tax=Erythrobacter litoralis TaxID=39960 RepID=A0A074M5H8_9SPHN|nr:FKBP-type peptidyl-prolyl cis-trans isomerase [Erythrobacter litoralis]AOL22666.1 peptidylprolyl isomerase/FKBP-type peptidyl-prolyl cis-trans isomerase SlyD [Erythrobacter litoralis]KEO89966.1 peptidylprolyl isomerase [Erythrobacter litoralis]MEE4338282.1 FKBP-type peptidyl-prolyl cis-trans isomerase [Erythrobacter sp.]
MATAKNGDTVAIDYVVKTKEGRVVGGTEGQGPQTLTLGNDEIFPQIESALTQMEVGAEDTVTIDAEHAFGPRREELIVEIPRANLPPDAQPQPGMTLSAQQNDGQPIQLVITDVKEESVTADGNHPLAGEDLIFGLTLVEIKQAA